VIHIGEIDTFGLPRAGDPDHVDLDAITPSAEARTAAMAGPPAATGARPCPPPGA
jgi:hypothetical protein